ncbi:hypothetical protein C8Q73DRAFT_748900 [Cubamyces lactineus]|nr:hypothetical protein C8Q73DRAFT_748900 [Cubamyces lactineus]
MTSKTLSNGTLSLRFMQNAHRAKLQAQVELEQAKIKDDAEWSVSQEIRDAWGIGQASSSSNDDVVYEPSYVPFIFDSDAAEASSSNSPQQDMPKLRGRRTFNARGEEIVQEEKPQEEEENVVADAPEEKPRSKFDKRPTSISGFKAPISTQRDGKKTRTKTAQMLIREDVSVRPPASMQTSILAVKREEGFIKPEGVDEPIRTARRAPTEGRKRERDQDTTGADRTGSEGKKRKKKKEAST